MTGARRGFCAAAAVLFALFPVLPAKAVLAREPQSASVRGAGSKERARKVEPRDAKSKAEPRDAKSKAEPRDVKSSASDPDIRVRTTATKDREERRISLVRAAPEDGKDTKRGKDGKGKKEKKRERKIRPLPPGATWTKYRAAPWRRGYVTVQGHGKKWTGYLVDSAGDVIPGARRAVSEALSSWRTGREMLMDERLLALVADVSDEFGGRPVRIVSGYREHSYAPDSKHKIGQAFDFSVPGVPNEQLRDFLKSIPDVGVGFYPNSTHVHLDVRDKSCYWVDYSAPGERPMYAWQRRNTRRGIVTPAERALASALDDLATHPLRAERLSKIAPRDEDREPTRAASRDLAPDGGAPASTRVPEAGAAALDAGGLDAHSAVR